MGRGPLFLRYARLLRWIECYATLTSVQYLRGDRVFHRDNRTYKPAKRAFAYDCHDEMHDRGADYAHIAHIWAAAVQYCLQIAHDSPRSGLFAYDLRANNTIIWERREIVGQNNTQNHIQKGCHTNFRGKSHQICGPIHSNIFNFIQNGKPVVD